MTTAEKRAYILSRFGMIEDDSLERCELAFRGLSDAELDKQHGESGHTRRWWLEEYRKHRRIHLEAKEFLERLLESAQ